MKQPIGKYEFAIDAYLTDFRGRATLPMIGGFMLQAATKHAEERGFGYNDMTGQQRAWVLSRMAIEIFEYPQNDTIFTINTWVADVNRLFTERYFSFENANGKIVGYAKSIWASIDLITRRPTNVNNLDELLAYIDKDLECPIDGLKKIAPLKENFDLAMSFVVKYSDIDINKHLNSMKYIEHFVDIFNIEMYEEKEIRRFEINYINEGHYGQHININKRDENDCTFILEMKEQETVICAARVVWQ